MYNLFISHSWSYSNQYEGLVGLLDKANGFVYKNYSVPKDDPVHNAENDDELKEAIKEQMSHASVVLILAGLYANYSKWIDIEIDLAQNGFNKPKPIIAVEYWGAEHTSKVVKDAANKIVKWNTNSIVNAIKELVD